MNAKMNTTYLLLIGILIMLLTFPGGVAAKGSKIDYEKMKRDLTIMKVILDRLMKPDNSRMSWANGNTRAIYLDGYGVIFNYQYSMSKDLELIRTLSSEEAYQNTLERYKEEQEKAIQLYEEALKKAGKFSEHIGKAVENLERTKKITQTKRDKLAKETKKMKEKLKQNIIEFLGEYCDAINQLNPNDRITVVILPEMSPYFHFGTYLGQKRSGMNRLAATVQKSDITSYRKEAIDKKAFERHIHFSSDIEDERMKRDIEIMTNIFDTALKQSPQHALVARGETWGTYIDNFGVLFMMKVRGTLGLEIHHLDIDEEQIIISTNNESPKSSKEAPLENLKATLIDVLGSYGHSMRKLNRDKWIGIALESKLTEWKHDNGFNTLFIKVRKRDTDALNKDRINFETFKRRVVVTEY